MIYVGDVHTDDGDSNTVELGCDVVEETEKIVVINGRRSKRGEW